MIVKIPKPTKTLTTIDNWYVELDNYEYYEVEMSKKEFDNL